jgi:hypothetical protein
MLQLKDNMRHADFHLLSQYVILLEVHTISSVLCDIAKLSKSVIDADVLTFQYYNDTHCSLVYVPESGT